jgi:pimeloyl-ACP methyl ester carboxylesterase
MSLLVLGELSLHYIEFGQTDEVVLFVHGNWCSSRCWLPTMARLPRRFRTIALDQRGFGYSSKPPGEYSIPQRAADLRGFADALGLDRFHLVGHSLGGAVAVQFALEHSDRLRTLFLLDSAPASGLPVSPAVRALQDRFAADRSLLEPALALALCLELRDPVFQVLLDDACAMARHSVQPNLDALANWCVLDELASLRVPTTLAWGDQDLVISREMCEELHRSIANSRLHIFEQIGHSPNLADPDGFTAVLLEALTGAEA